MDEIRVKALELAIGSVANRGEYYCMADVVLAAVMFEAYLRGETDDTAETGANSGA